MLSQSEFIPEMQKLSSFFAKTQNSDQLLIWFDRCKNLHLSAFKDAVNFCIENEKFFPTPRTLLEKADIAQRQHQAKVASDESKQARKVVSGYADGKPGAYGPEYGSEAREIFSLAMGRVVTGNALADAMDAMDAKWPGLGWSDEAQSVRRNAEERNKLKNSLPT